MRMHSYGKCSPNLAAGALTIFVLIVLYNYWNISTLNRDLSIKLHSLEQQIITFSRANEGLSSNLEKVQDEKSNLQNTLIKEEEEEKASRDLVSQKEKLIKDLQNDLENSKQEALNCLHESSSQDNKLQLKEKEITELKEKVVSLEAQVVEKTSQNEKIEMELGEAKEKVENLQKLVGNRPTAASKSTAASVGAKPVVPPEEQQPVLINDPAVPYPDGWMKPHYSIDRPDPKVHIEDVNVGLKGMKHYRGMPIILNDRPDSPRKQARFSVLDPPKNKDQFRPYNGYEQQQQRDNYGRSFEIQMNPAVSKDPKMPEPLKQPNGLEETGPGPSGKDNNGEEGGVLPVPGQPPAQNDNNKESPQVPQPPQGGNLDAAEDDGDRQVKEDQALQDDQSPDGALPKENIVAVAPAPNVNNKEGIPPPPHSGQDAREDAHLMHGNNL